MRAAAGSRRSLADTTSPLSQQAAAAAATQSSSSKNRDIVPSGKAKYMVMDGNEAAAYVAYAMSDISFIYPISPATSMGEHMDKWAASGKKNILGQVVDINMMQSEAGAAGALHGACAAGTLASTFTASQGLLLMIPNMYLLAGELMPTVFHVSARTLSKHALSIFNDHSDVMACRQTGFAMMASSCVQEVMDLGTASHISSLKSRIPFLHFFDGYRTSAEMSKIQVIPYEDMAKIFPYDKVKENLHNFALNPYHPSIRGTGQRPDIFFQTSVAANRYYMHAPDIVEETLYDLGKLTGRNYSLFDYHGSPTAERVAVCMGSAGQTIEESVDYLNQHGENVGVINVHLFRPWSAKHFLSALPKTCTKIAVLDKTKEEGAAGMPLYLDINITMSEANQRPLITGATYGLASKEFTPAMVKAVFDNLNAAEPRKHYVVGVHDDVTHTSLEYGEPINVTPPTTKQCLFWGLGSDGTVGANKTAIKTIGLSTDLKAQGHFVFDSHKSDGVTVSHLRFGPDEIKSEYTIQSNADFLSCSHPSYVYKYEMLDPLKNGGIFVLNSPWHTLEELDQRLPAKVKRDIASKKLEFYNIDATSIARQVGLGKRVNVIMQAAFYGVSGVLPQDQALQLLKGTISEQYARKGPEVIAKNHKAVDVTLEHLKRVTYPESWATATSGGQKPGNESVQRPEFVKSIMDPVLALEGDKLPVSAFEPGGYQPIGTTKFEKRGIAPVIPVWKPDACTQCNYCAIVCPHAVIRPFLLDKNEQRLAPEGFETRKAKGGTEVGGFNYTIQVSPFDCTGCEVCVESCPDDALYMAPFKEVAEKHSPHWDYAISLPEKTEIGDKYTVKGSQFLKPLFEFSGACAGCGETPYLKLATQLFGDRMVIANASGCSSVFGGTSTTIPFTTNKDGRGPAWGRSLFEDNAEYGFGMMLATRQRRQKLRQDMTIAILELPLPDDVKAAFHEWIEFFENPDKCEHAATMVETALKRMGPNLDPRLSNILEQRDMLRTQSHWMVGGDGWAYDIGYGGVDHVLSRGENVNLLVLDTEMYSNTGGQVSKATQLATVTKYATHGKRQVKKDLGLCAMQYENVYVASVALGANMNQCVQAFKEAEHYPGASLIIAYSPCIDWGIEMKNMMHEQKEAVESGYWTLYRYDPRRAEKGLNPFQLDSKKIKYDLQQFLDGQNRFEQLRRADKKTADTLHKGLRREMHARHEKLLKLAMDEYEMLDHLKKRLGEETSTDSVMVLFGSETGNAAALAQVWANEFKRRGIRAKCAAMDDVDLDEVTKQSQVFCVVATCGQGEFPANCRDFWKALSDPSNPKDLFQNTKFAIFGLGDSSYVYFNEAAKRFHRKFEELGGKVVTTLGLGDDKDEDKYESKWNDWLPYLWNELGTPPPSMELLPPSYSVTVESAATTPVPEVHVPSGCRLVPMTKNVVLTPPDYDRDIRHYEFDLRGLGMSYSPGDCLGIYPHNNKNEVLRWCAEYGLDPSSVLKLSDLQSRKDSLPPLSTVGQLFTEVLDIFGKPPRRFYETLQISAKDSSEQKELEFLLSKEGSGKFKEFIKETPTFADLMKLYPSTKLSLEYMLDHIPQIKPRLYSIASSLEMHKESVHLCIVKNDWTTPSGQLRLGLCTRYLAGLSLGNTPDVIKGKINAAGITVPNTHAFPCVMVGLGTGIAPFRAMVQDREMARIRGDKIGPMALFFGARHKRTDYTYGDEFSEYHSNGNGVLKVLSTAFSRDQAHKIYVQDRISEYPEVIYDYLGKRQGYFYLCGPAGNVPPSVRKAVVNAFVKCGGHSQEEADKIVTQMQIEGRYNVEAW
jgi:homodimeric pyruvate:ferredoxin (flavodoxin) oxidoreductase